MSHFWTNQQPIWFGLYFHLSDGLDLNCFRQQFGKDLGARVSTKGQNNKYVKLGIGSVRISQCESNLVVISIKNSVIFPKESIS